MNYIKFLAAIIAISAFFASAEGCSLLCCNKKEFVGICAKCKTICGGVGGVDVDISIDDDDDFNVDLNVREDLDFNLTS